MQDFPGELPTPAAVLRSGSKLTYSTLVGWLAFPLLLLNLMAAAVLSSLIFGPRESTGETVGVFAAAVALEGVLLVGLRVCEIAFRSHRQRVFALRVWKPFRRTKIADARDEAVFVFGRVRVRQAIQSSAHLACGAYVCRRPATRPVVQTTLVAGDSVFWTGGHLAGQETTGFDFASACGDLLIEDGSGRMAAVAACGCAMFGTLLLFSRERRIGEGDFVGVLGDARVRADGALELHGSPDQPLCVFVGPTVRIRGLLKSRSLGPAAALPHADMPKEPAPTVIRVGEPAEHTPAQTIPRREGPPASTQIREAKDAGAGFEVGSEGALSNASSSETILLNDYVVERQLGAGGQGEVLLVRSRSTDARYAVKRARVAGADAAEVELRRRAFLAELGTWIDLPDHPSLARLHFVRTSESDLLLFAEYVECGSLLDWAGDSHAVDMKALLAMALRSAWAMHVAHALDVVHQDIKPENFLTGADGSVKLADFGLARARRTQGEHAIDVLGFTPAYRAPEQVHGGRVDARSDIYSWAASILKLWLGEAAVWHDGLALAFSTEECLDAVPEQGRPRIPKAFADVLRKCLRSDPAERFAAAGEIVAELQRTYQAVTGAPFLGRLTPPPARPCDQPQRAMGRGFRPGAEWLAVAYRTLGRTAAPPSPPLGRSWQSRVVGELLAYEEAASLLATTGAENLEMARLHADKAFVHAELGDMPGAWGSFESAAAFFGTDVDVVHDFDAIESWGNDCKWFASLALRARRNDWAIEAYSKAISAIGRSTAAGSGSLKLRPLLVELDIDRAHILVELGDAATALRCFDRALKALNDCSNQDALLRVRARGLQGRAKALHTLGELEAAITACDPVIALLERHAKSETRSTNARAAVAELAIAITDKANWLREVGRLAESLECHDRAVKLAEELSESFSDAEEMLAMYCQNKAYVARLSGNIRLTLELLARGIEIRERIAARTGESEARAAVAEAYWNAAIDLQHLDLVEEALAMFDKAIGIYEPLIDREGRQEFLPKLARAYGGKASCLVASAGAVFAQGMPRGPGDDGAFMWMLDRFVDAKDLHQRAAAVFERLWSEVQAPHYAVDLARAKLNLASVYNLLLDKDAARRAAEEALQLSRECSSPGELRDELQKIGAAALTLIARCDAEGGARRDVQ